MLCIIRGGKRWTHQGRTREKTTATKSWKLAVSLISGWQMQETQLRASSGQSGESPWFRPRNPSVAQATWPLWKKGWDLPQGVGQSSLTGAAPYTHIAPPFPLPGDCHLCRNVESLWKTQTRRQRRSRWSEQMRGKTKRHHRQGVQLTTRTEATWPDEH